MRKISIFLLGLLCLAACTPQQPENQPQEPDVPEVPEVIDYGDGTKERPFVIDNTARLEEFMKIYKDAAQPTDKNQFKFYACMIADVDASSIAWTPLNAAGSFYKAIDFDGKGHTISNLKASGTYASFAGVLYGNVRNVTFSNATINGGGSNCGVVAGFLGTNGLPGSCENVVVTGSTVTGTRYVGGFAGHTRSTGSVTGCRVENSTLTSTSYIAGFSAYVDLGSDDKYDVPAIFRDCHVSDVTINQNNTAGGDIYTAGFAGYTSYETFLQLENLCRHHSLCRHRCGPDRDRRCLPSGKKMKILFDSGTLVLENIDPEVLPLELLPLLKNDARTGSFRSRACDYREIVLALLKAGVNFTDSAKKFAPLESLTLKENISLRPHQQEAFDAWFLSIFLLIFCDIKSDHSTSVSLIALLHIILRRAIACPFHSLCSFLP